MYFEIGHAHDADGTDDYDEDDETTAYNMYMPRMELTQIKVINTLKMSLTVLNMQTPKCVIKNCA